MYGYANEASSLLLMEDYIEIAVFIITADAMLSCVVRSCGRVVFSKVYISSFCIAIECAKQDG